MADTNQKWYNWIFKQREINQRKKDSSWLRSIVSGALYRVSDIRGTDSFSTIKTQIETMRALAMDSQISTALNYYATDATTTNSSGQILWATAPDPKYNEVADIVNELLKRWKIVNYARDHILELATVGNLYIPTTNMYKDDPDHATRKKIALDNNTIPESDYDIIPSYKIPPDTILHLWRDGQPCGYLMDPKDDQSDIVLLPETACIHFSLGGLLGDYTLSTRNRDGEVVEYDIQFATPLMAQAVQPTQTLNLLEDAVVLSSLARTVKIINVRCGKEEDEIMSSLQIIKDTLEQQLSLNTSGGDVQSFVNPQSPNNFIYVPFVDGQEAITVTDLNMFEANNADSKLLDYYQDKKLSVLGVPKEAMNFSSNEGLGGAGSVLSQRSALYANSLQRLETAYMNGWRDAINLYFSQRNMNGFVDKFDLHMNPIVTQLSTIVGEKRDAALSQTSQFIDILKSLGVTKEQAYKSGLVELLQEEFPVISADLAKWNVNIESESQVDTF